jgi:hypothetical protein
VLRQAEVVVVSSCERLGEGAGGLPQTAKERGSAAKVVRSRTACVCTGLSIRAFLLEEG